VTGGEVSTDIADEVGREHHGPLGAGGIEHGEQVIDGGVDRRDIRG